MKRCFSCFKEYGDKYNVCPHCGQVELVDAKEPIYLVPGTVLANRYIVGDVVGAGGFGIIYKAWDFKLETIVAVKEFFVSRLATRAQGTKKVIITKKSCEEFKYRKERFIAEARNMAKFGTHKNIPNVFEFFEENDTAYIVMELLNGMALNEYLRQHGGKVDIEFALFITNEVGNALKSLHNAGIVHRDVAPDNIYICSGVDIKIKLLDLGAAKLADSTDNAIDIILKPGYSPTEQYDNSKNIGSWTDIYALGATLYMMLTGVKPAESTNRKIEDEVVPPGELNPKISENLNNAIMKAMAIDIHMRFKNVSEFLKAVNGNRKVLSLEKEKKKRNRRRFSSILTSLAAVGILILFTMGILEQKRAEEELAPANINIWYAVKEGSKEQEAMEYMVQEFTTTFPNVNVELTVFPEEEYERALQEAVVSGTLPDLFESTGIDPVVLEAARDATEVMESEQFAEALFLDQYSSYYGESCKQIPLAVEVPVACVITNGATFVDWQSEYFSNVEDFGNIKISMDEYHQDLVQRNFTLDEYSGRDAFLDNESNTSPVMLSSTMVINEVRERLQNYEKEYVFYDAEQIKCNFIYEWSLGTGTEEAQRASDRLLSWMLGNVYQSILMTSKNNEGQIPVNPICFDTKIQTRNLTPINTIYEKFVF